MTSSSLSARFRQNLYTKQHLEVISALLGRIVLKEELGSLEDARTQREASQVFINQPVTKCEIPFADRKLAQFKHFIERLRATNSCPIYLWTEHSIDCGLILVPSLFDIKFDTDFVVGRNEGITCVTSDFCDRLQLDFSEPYPGDQRLEIETSGKNWLDVRYES